MVAKKSGRPPRPTAELNTIRKRLDDFLEQVRGDREFTLRLLADPRAVLEAAGLADPWVIVAEQWGVGPSADCGHDTCRLTDPCGWTVCGKTTNSCGPLEDELRHRMDQVLAQVRSDDDLRTRLLHEPEETLRELGFEPQVHRFVVEQWGVGPSADCGHDTCRLTDPCGWTVCGKTTNSCSPS